MKNNIKLTTWLVGSLLTFSACTDLNVDLKSTYTEYPDSEIAKEAKMAGLYYGFGGALGRRYMEAALLSSDEFMAVTFGGNWYDGGNYIHSSLHASLPGDAHVDWAGDIPAAITKCNQAIFDLGGEGSLDCSGTCHACFLSFYFYGYIRSNSQIRPLDRRF